MFCIAESLSVQLKINPKPLPLVLICGVMLT